MSVHDFHQNEAVYAIAIQNADYRRACWIAIGALRRSKDKASTAVWRRRLCGSLRLRGVS